jgi:hypothetical protein
MESVARLAGQMSGKATYQELGKTQFGPRDYSSIQGAEGDTIRLGLGWIIIRIGCGGLSLEASLLCVPAAC